MVLTNLPPFFSRTQEDSDKSMMTAKQGVSMMHDSICNACMHDARAMQQIAYISQFLQVRYNIHPSNLIPPTHEFNGVFLFLGFLAWASISTGDIKNRRACQSLKAVKHTNSISRYKGLVQSLLA